MGIRVALNHRTCYRYDKPSQLSPHVVRLRPAPHCRTSIESYSLKVLPEKHFINWQQDPFGNYLARLVFPEPATELLVEVDLIAEMTVINPFDFFVEDYAEQYPFNYNATNLDELQPYLKIEDNGPLLSAWLDQNTPESAPIIDWLVMLNQRLQRDIAYQIRMEPGVLAADETLHRGIGSCRDSGWLLVQILRHCGLAARFVSGYLLQLTADEKALDGPSGPDKDFTDLHAWAEVYLPGAGWVGLDPTSGLFAGEGHIPLSCTPTPASAAAISGAADPAASAFDFSNTIRRIEEKVRVTKPYTDEDWHQILSLGARVDQQLAEQDVRLTMGGEPTFVFKDNMEGEEWNFTALSDEKLALATDLLLRMRERFAPHGLPAFHQGKWYPGEATPRWALTCYWRVDGKPLWHNADALALPGRKSLRDPHLVEHFARCLTRWLGVADSCLLPLYEDPLYHVQLESILPDDASLETLELSDNTSRRNLARRLSAGLEHPVGWVLPLRKSAAGWASCRWSFRRDQVFLVPGDSPAGLRLPLDALPGPDEEAALALPEDAFAPDQPLSYTEPDLTDGKPVVSTPLDATIPTAVCIECRDNDLYVFLPPTRSAEEFVALLAAVERAALEAGVAVIMEGYEPPADSRLQLFKITPDPGVIEVNIAPVNSFPELVEQTESLYKLAQQTRLTAEKFLVDGRHTGTGGGNHITFGGPTPADSPFLRRPSLLGSLITYWQHHPSLSYLFSGLFLGPTSQAPRIDEARHESLYELEMALQRLPKGDCDQPWLVDRLLRNLLVDVTGNTHRTEICIDKLYSPDGPAGRQGLVEFRAFEMPPHPRMSIAQALLLRSLISRFWDQPYTGNLVRWGSELHDRFMLPHYLWADISEVISDLQRHGIDYQPHWLDAFWEFRFPMLGTRQIGDITLELRAAIEPWYVLGEQAGQASMSRYVDSSMERLQLKVSGLNDERHFITCNGSILALRNTGVVGEYVTGIRFRAWQPPNCLHPDLPVDTPLVIDVVDRWMNRSLGGCAYHVAHPGGRSYEDVPVNANVAEARRLARFTPDFHTPDPTVTRTATQEWPVQGSTTFTELAGGKQAVAWTPAATNPDFPNTADLRWLRSRNNQSPG